MPQNKYTPKINQLEKEAQFSSDIKPVNQKFVKEMVPNKFKYKRKNVFYRLYSFFVNLIVLIFGPIVTSAWFKLKIEGRKNLKKAKKCGAIIVANHVHTLDPLYIRQVNLLKIVYYLAAPFNNKKGLAGLTLKVAGILPIASGVELRKELNNVIADLLKRKQYLTIYAEGSMWMGYTKIRPLKTGAFHFAVKNNVPVIPVVTLFRQSKKQKVFNKYRITLKVLEPIFASEEGSNKEKIIAMRDKCHNQMVECATNFYGYDCDATHYSKVDDEKVILIEKEIIK